jgi:hypothetical protein
MNRCLGSDVLSCRGKARNKQCGKGPDQSRRVRVGGQLELESWSLVGVNLCYTAIQSYMLYLHLLVKVGLNT